MRSSYRAGAAGRLAGGPLPRHPDRAVRPADGGARPAGADAQGPPGRRGRQRRRPAGPQRHPLGRPVPLTLGGSPARALVRRAPCPGTYGGCGGYRARRVRWPRRVRCPARSQARADPSPCRSQPVLDPSAHRIRAPICSGPFGAATAADPRCRQNGPAPPREGCRAVTFPVSSQRGWSAGPCRRACCPPAPCGPPPPPSWEGPGPPRAGPRPRPPAARRAPVRRR